MVTEQEEAKRAVDHVPQTPLHGTSKGKCPSTYEPQSSQQTENDVLRRRLEEMQAQLDQQRQLLQKQHRDFPNAKKHIETEFRQRYGASIMPLFNQALSLITQAYHNVRQCLGYLLIPPGLPGTTRPPPIDTSICP